MDGGELQRLARLLSAIAAKATREPGDPLLTRGEIAVLRDTLGNPRSSIGDITARTGFTQGHVSSSVAQLERKGYIETERDAVDGRRTLVRVKDEVAAMVHKRTGRSIDGALAAVLDHLGPAELKEFHHCLDRLVRLVPPDLLNRIDGAEGASA